MNFDRKIFFDKIRPTIEVPGFGLLPIQVDGLGELLTFIENDSRWTEMDEDVAIRTISYFLATVAIECTIKMKVGSKNLYVKAFKPAQEMGGTNYLNRMYDTRTDLGNTRAHDGDGAQLSGDGYVQNTGGNNARKTGKMLAGTEIAYEDISPDAHDLLAAFTREGGSVRTPMVIDAGTFIREHELLRVPKISYADAIDGMLSGRYTGKAIGDYINEDENDTFNARRVINGITAKNRPVVVEIARIAGQFDRALRGSLTDDAPAVVSEDIAGLTSPEQSTSPEILPEELPGVEDAPIPEGESPKPASAAAFTAYIPQIDTARSWIKRATAGTLAGTILSFLFKLPEWLQMGLFGLLVIIVIGAIFIVVKYHAQIFEYVTKMNEIRAQPETANFHIAPAK